MRVFDAGTFEQDAGEKPAATRGLGLAGAAGVFCLLLACIKFHAMYTV